MSKPDNDPLRSLTRLAIGSAMLGMDGLMHQLRLWEQETNRELTDNQQSQPGTIIDVPGESAPKVDVTGDTLRYALIGLLFETQNQVQHRVKEVERSTRQVEALLTPALEALEQNEMLAPVRQEFDRLVERGESEVARLVALGRAEEDHSRRLLNNAMAISADTTISQVVENPRVEELVQRQSVGLANELVEEVRERGVSIDSYLEKWARLLLGRKARDEVPEPAVPVELPRAHLHSHES